MHVRASRCVSRGSSGTCSGVRLPRGNCQPAPLPKRSESRPSSPFAPGCAHQHAHPCAQVSAYKQAPSFSYYSLQKCGLFTTKRRPMTALDLGFIRKTAGGASDGRSTNFTLDRMTALQLARRTVIFTVDAAAIASLVD